MKPSYFTVERLDGERWVFLWEGPAADAADAWRRASRLAFAGEALRVKQRGNVLLEQKKP